MGPHETVSPLLACRSHFVPVMGGGGENATLGVTGGWRWQAGADLFFSTVFSMFRGYSAMCNSTRPAPIDRLCPLGDPGDDQTWQEAPWELSHGPDGSTEAGQAVSLPRGPTDGGAWRVCSAPLCLANGPGHPVEAGAFPCGNAGKITMCGVETSFWQGAQANGSVCRGSQWVPVAKGEV